MKKEAYPLISANRSSKLLLLVKMVNFTLTLVHASKTRKRVNESSRCEIVIIVIIVIVIIGGK